MTSGQPERTFRADRVLSRGISVFLKNIVPFTLLTALIYSPFAVYAAVKLSGAFTLNDAVTVLYVISFGGLLAQILASATVMHGTIAQLRGERATVLQSLKVGLLRLFPVLGVAILVGLCVMAGAVLLLVPGLILMVKFWVAVPVAVVERPGVTASMRRSSELVRGEGWSVFALMVLLFILNLGLTQLLQQAWDIEALALSELKTYLAVNLAISVITTAFGAVVAAVSYHDLRVAKEEIRTEDIARAILR